MGNSHIGSQSVLVSSTLNSRVRWDNFLRQGEISTANPHRRDLFNAGFTLVELLVVIAITGVLIALLLPAVQYCRESARRATCSNNLKNQAVALHLFHDANKSFPAGNSAVRGLDHSWSIYALPYMEQGNVFDQIDLKKPWNDEGGNYAATRVVLPIFRCPSSIWEEEGDSDYTGIMGSGAAGADWDTALRNGVLVTVWEPGGLPVRFGDITDGTSSTLLVVECADRPQGSHGNWGDGLGGSIYCDGAVNQAYGDVFSHHAGGSFAAYADGGVTFLPSTVEKSVVGALCTRNEKELVVREF